MEELLLLLCRIQFALTITFHYLFPPMSIGIGLMIVLMEGKFLWTRQEEDRTMARFWTKIFSLFFAMGVASGFVQLFAFGNNWARFSTFVGDVFGSLLAAEGIFAFFLEASFMGLMLFGWDRVKPGVHYLATCLVVFGAHFSAIWIIMANSWMQTPAGYRIVGEGALRRAVIVNLREVFWTPSTMDRLVHTLLGCWILGGFMILSVSAYYLLKSRYHKFAIRGLRFSLGFLGVTLLLQLVSADSTARGVSKNQPVKFAAMEGVFETKEYTPISVFGYVNMEEEKVEGLQIPGLLSFLAYRDFKEPVPGLNEIAPKKEDRPNIQWTFQCYHLMILSWGVMVLLVFIATVQLLRKKIFTQFFFLRLLVFSIAFPYVANLAGWYVAEIGRQPWVVQGLLRTSEAVSKGSISVRQLYSSLTLFSTMYLLLFSLFLFLLLRKIKKGPHLEETKDEDRIYRSIS